MTSYVSLAVNISTEPSHLSNLLEVSGLGDPWAGHTTRYPSMNMNRSKIYEACTLYPKQFNQKSEMNKIWALMYLCIKFICHSLQCTPVHVICM